MTRFYTSALLVLLFSVFGQSKTVCSSLEKLANGQSKHIVEFYERGEMAKARNSFSTILLHDMARSEAQGYQPTYYAPCSPRPSGFGSLIKCDSSMGAAATLLIENVSNSGAFQDGPFKLFNMKCTK